MESFNVSKNNRVTFTHIQELLEIPDLLSIQTKAYQQFLQEYEAPEARKDLGLQAVLNSVFPIEDSHRNYILEFNAYYLGQPKYTGDECIDRGVTFSVPLRVKLSLHITDESNKNEYAQSIEQDVYFGNIPYMTEKGTFIINGAERVIVSQLQRSPGVFFDESTHPNGTKLFQARIIPARGSWVDFTTDINDCLFVIIDRRRKFPVTMLLRALGYSSNSDICKAFGNLITKKVKGKGLEKYIGATITEDVIDTKTGEIFFESGTELSGDIIEKLKENGVDEINLVDGNKDFSSMLLLNTISKDPTRDTEGALQVVYQLLRTSEPPNLETAQKFIERIFFSPKKYDLGQVGRYRLNQQFNLDVPVEETVLTMEDIIQVLVTLIDMRRGDRGVDDIDHLGNRRVKTIGEQLTNQFSIALSRMIRTIHERMNLRESESITPQDLINSRVVTTVINTFFGTSQLSQFGDQTNPLAEITHKRRISALGPGGLTRERAGFEVRDVHYTHYGRLCPIETPEGPNIGLISSLSVFAKVNNLGFIETPYREVNKGSVDVKKAPIYLSAEEEEGKKIAQSNLGLDKNGAISGDKVIAREEGDFPVVTPDTIDYMDVAPNQIASISASLIPFLEHDDANRALMGSNMMRQAVPLLRPESPIVGTGLERRVAEDSRILINAEGAGVVEYVDANKITIKYDRTDQEKLVSFDTDEKSYDLIKFRKTNQGTCINLKPIVSSGDRVEKGQVLCEGYATQKGELALGRNMKVAFMPWKGYNFEDAIVISEKVVREDIFTSIHIDEYSLDVRDTKLGTEELTNDIPNVSEEATKDLDENGMIRIGAEVNPGDILIGKITPKGESDPTPEEKLLRAIFGDKAGDVKDASLKASPSLRGVVIDKKLFKRALKDKTKRLRDKEAVTTLEASFVSKFDSLKENLVEKLFQLVSGKTSQGVFNDLGEEVLPKGKKYTLKMLNAVDDYVHLTSGTWTTDAKINAHVSELIHNYKIKVNDLQGVLRREKFTISVGDELPAGILKLAKIYVAKKRKLKVGDKMAGRHGNKGIVARIVRQEDMPFLEDGTPVDIVLNPLGVPSRMNIGQIYETVLGWAGQKLDRKYATPIFDGASLNQINEFTDEANVPRFGHTYLYDGGTGKRFDQPATVGVIYMIKLGHMIEDKMHARSIGPYSLITQQPLGGKAQFGGQRFGEMEVWALEAYGASSILREILTVKSDDVMGRAKTYESIVKGETMPEPGLPESFNVLMHELKGLGLDLKLEE